ncbi:MAG TPA: adenylate/guanylate cyclase domain-containing protein [Candidatus Limnocylindria bacterium]
MPEEVDRGNEEIWRSMLMGTNRFVRFGHSTFARLPSPPRCELCATPFKGPFTPVLRAFGKAPFAKNPRYCAVCIGRLMKKKGGAEVELSALFADVRGSTPMAERLGAAGMHEMMDRFYSEGVDALIRGGALIERFMGDQIVGYFVPGYAGRDHAKRALETALEVLRVTGNAGRGPAWIPVGVGVHSGTAFIGTVGRTGGLLELTALGEDVNVAARLASEALAGEIVCSEVTFDSAGLDFAAERREVMLKGVTKPVAVRVVRP